MPTFKYLRMPKQRPSSNRHSVCRMVITHVSQTRFPLPKSDSHGRQIHSDPVTLSTEYSGSPSPSTLRISCDPVHQECEKNSTSPDGFILPTLKESCTTYFRSSVADKMSDYEDIWCDKTSARSLTPAESENQFKVYTLSYVI